MDVFSRMIRGWHTQSTLDAISDVETLRDRHYVKVSQRSIILIKAFSIFQMRISRLLTHHGIEISVARRGCPWENGYAERLIRTLKEEEVHLNDYKDVMEARDRIGHFITQVYHQKRPHSALGYLTPIEFQRKNLA